MSVSETEALRLSRPVIYSAQRPPDYCSLSTLLKQINDMKNELNVLSRIVTKLECQVPLQKNTEMDNLFENPIGYNVTLTTQTSPTNTYVRHLKVPESQKSFKFGSSYKILNHRGLNSGLENNNTSENLEKPDIGNNEKHSYETLSSFSMDRSWDNSIIGGEKAFHSQMHSAHLSNKNRISEIEDYQRNTTDVKLVTNMHRDSNSSGMMGRKEEKELSLSFPSQRKDFEETCKNKYFPTEERKESSLTDNETHFMPTYISALKVVTSRPPNTKRTIEFGERCTSKSYFDFADYYLQILDLHDRAVKKQKSTTLTVSTSG